MNNKNHSDQIICDDDILSSDELISFECKKTHLSNEDRTALAAQELLVSRHRGPGRVIDTSGSFKSFSARMSNLQAKRRPINTKTNKHKTTNQFALKLYGMKPQKVQCEPSALCSSSDSLGCLDFFDF